MVISPVLRGMFGLEWNVAEHTLTVTPHLPAAWPGAMLRRVPFGESWLDLAMTRENGTLIVKATGPAAAGLKLASEVEGAHADRDTLRIPLPAVEAGATEALPKFGSETHQMKVLGERYGAHSLTLQLSAPGGSVQELTVRENRPGLKMNAEGAELGAVAGGLRPLTVHFADASGYTTQTITLSW